MKTKRALLLFCFTLAIAGLFAQQKDDTKITITKNVLENDGSYSSETIVKKGQAAREFNIDQYVKDNKAENVDLDIRLDGSDEERTVVVKGSKGPRNNRNIDLDELGRDMTEEVARSVNWVSRSINRNWYDDDENPNRAFLGVEEDSDEDSDENGLVVEITRNSAADKAGLRNNDVITSLNDTKINSWSDLTQFINAAKPGDKVKIMYTRNGKEMSADAELTRRKDVKPVDCMEQAPKGFLGVSPATDEEDTPGATISVIKKSGAEKAGLKRGDIILQLNNTKIEDFEDIEDFMEYIKPGETIKIKYRRGDKENTIEATTGAQQPWDWGQTDWKENEINIRTKEACLGVCNGSAHQGTSVVSFTQNSAAQAAGLKIGDIILSVDGDRVQNCADVWNALSAFGAGSKVSLTYLRNDDELTAEVTLNTCSTTSSYGQVTITDTDGLGNASERKYYCWDMEKEDEDQLRQKQTIPIRKASDSDVPALDAIQGSESNPIQNERTLSLSAFRAYPNPTPGELTLEFKVAPRPTMINLYDINGRQLFQEELNAFNGQYIQQFDLSALSKSTVIVRVQQGEQVYMEQILVQ